MRRTGGHLDVVDAPVVLRIRRRDVSSTHKHEGGHRLIEFGGAVVVFNDQRGVFKYLGNEREKDGSKVIDGRDQSY